MHGSAITTCMSKRETFREASATWRASRAGRRWLPHRALHGCRGSPRKRSGDGFSAHRKISAMPLRILMMADTPADPNRGAAGTEMQTVRALRALGHEVDDIW